MLAAFAELRPLSAALLPAFAAVQPDFAVVQPVLAAVQPVLAAVQPVLAACFAVRLWLLAMQSASDSLQKAGGNHRKLARHRLLAPLTKLLVKMPAFLRALSFAKFYRQAPKTSAMRHSPRISAKLDHIAGLVT